MSTATPQPTQWAIIELFGHQRIAGAVSEQTFGGSSLVRVDVPVVEIEDRRFDREQDKWVPFRRTIPAHTRSFGPGAIYSINWCDEPAARVAAAGILHKPISDYTLRESLGNMPVADRQALLAYAGGGDDHPF